jgi:hypothetical protein
MPFLYSQVNAAVLAVLHWSNGWPPKANTEIDEHARLLLLSCVIMAIAAPDAPARADPIQFREGSSPGPALAACELTRVFLMRGHPRPPRSRLPAILIALSRSSGATFPRYQCLCRGRYLARRESTPRGRRQRPIARAPSAPSLIRELWVITAVAGGVDAP